MISLICVWINAWVNNRDAGDLRRHRAYYDVTVMPCGFLWMYERDLNLGARIFQQQFSVFSPAKVRLKQQLQAFIHCSKRRRMTIRLVWLLMLLINQTANQKKDNELPICKYFSSKFWSTAVTRSTPRLTHWGRDKMAVVSQTTSSNAFSGMKILEFRLRFHWSLFLRVQLTIIQHCFR